MLAYITAPRVARGAGQRGRALNDRAPELGREVELKERGYRYAFAAAMSREGGDYGVALLSRFPFQRAERVDLRAPGAFEPRTAIDATVCAGEVPVRVVAVHEDVLPWAAADNTRALVKALSAGPGHVVVALWLAPLASLAAEGTPLERFGNTHPGLRKPRGRDKLSRCPLRPCARMKRQR